MDATAQHAESVLNPEFSMESTTYLTSLSISSDVLKQKYLQNKLSMRDIAKEFSCSKTQIRKLLLKYSIPLKEPSKYHKEHSRIFGKRKVNGKAIDNKKEQRVIESIKKMHEKGLGARAIARTLDTMNIPLRNKVKAGIII